MYSLTNHAYCGMSSVPREFEDLADVRKAAAARLRYLRNEGFPIETLTKGQEWEIQEPEDAVMVPDQCGMLVIREYQKCEHCGKWMRKHADGYWECTNRFCEPDEPEIEESLTPDED